MKIKKRKDPHRWSAILTIAKKKPAKIQALTGFKPVPSMYNNQPFPLGGKGPIPLLHELFEASFLQLLKSQPTLLCLLKYVI